MLSNIVRLKIIALEPSVSAQVSMLLFLDRIIGADLGGKKNETIHNQTWSN